MLEPVGISEKMLTRLKQFEVADNGYTHMAQFSFELFMTPRLLLREIAFRADDNESDMHAMADIVNSESTEFPKRK